MAKVLEIWGRKQQEGWTQQHLGMLMGYREESARKSVSQFLKSNDPHVSMLRRFAKAVGVKVASLVLD